MGWFARLNRRWREVREQPDADNYDEAAVWTAAWAHAEIIRIHPFEDGNGRSSRLVMTHVLVSLGLRPIPVEACKQEYTDALNAYFRTGELQPLIDLLLRLYPLP
jgi:Fic family protein